MYHLKKLERSLNVRHILNTMSLFAMGCVGIEIHIGMDFLVTRGANAVVSAIPLAPPMKKMEKMMEEKTSLPFVSEMENQNTETSRDLLVDGLYTKEECYRIEALHHAARIHEGLGTGSATVVAVAEVFERYLKTGR